jgi:hypothetical protein
VLEVVGVVAERIPSYRELGCNHSIPPEFLEPTRSLLTPVGSRRVDLPGSVAKPRPNLYSKISPSPWARGNPSHPQGVVCQHPTSRTDQFGTVLPCS